MHAQPAAGEIFDSADMKAVRRDEQHGFVLRIGAGEGKLRPALFRNVHSGNDRNFAVSKQGHGFAELGQGPFELQAGILFDQLKQVDFKPGGSACGIDKNVGGIGSVIGDTDDRARIRENRSGDGRHHKTGCQQPSDGKSLPYVRSHSLQTALYLLSQRSQCPSSDRAAFLLNTILCNSLWKVFFPSGLPEFLRRGQGRQRTHPVLLGECVAGTDNT